MGVVEVYLGQPLTFQKIVPGDTLTACASSIIKYEERKLPYTSGGTYVMKVGDKLVGATGAAVAYIVARTITSGADADGDAVGVLTIKCQVGAFESENLNVEANGNVCTIAAESVLNQDDYMYKGWECKAMLVQAIAQTALINVGNMLPGQTSTGGIELAAGASIILHDNNEIKNFYCIDKTSGSASTVKLVGYF